MQNSSSTNLDISIASSGVATLTFSHPPTNAMPIVLLEDLANAMKAEMEVIPGANIEISQPIQMRFNELMTGARQDVVCKIFGEDLDRIPTRIPRKQIIKTGKYTKASIHYSSFEVIPKASYMYA